jgi:large subunit ribosomal protein L16
MLMPKRTKFRKMMRGRMTGKAGRGATIAFGDYALQALEPAWITSRQIEAARRAITNYLKRGGKVWIRVFPDKPVTQKPAETRMGSGKGNPEFWVAVVKPGRIMFEVGGVPEDRAHDALQRAAMKMPIKCKVISKVTPGVVAETEEDAA